MEASCEAGQGSEGAVAPYTDGWMEGPQTVIDLGSVLLPALRHVSTSAKTHYQALAYNKTKFQAIQMSVLLQYV